MISLAITLHALAAAVWVGGMFFAYVCLRPAAAGTLEPPNRLALWRASLASFFAWVWVAVALLLATGYWMVLGFFGGFGGVAVHVHVMHALGIVMVALFAHVYFAPFKRLTRHVEQADWPAAGKQLNVIRQIVRINLLLGLVTVAVGAGGRYW